ncbi:hypothetical protein GCM10010466_56930 [Planomonospora alba]|uniref:Aminotransferase n=1 Tax=Planomonospora alba TaxID=161354 RepID=A0ABP6NV89_9ACTN
MEYSHYAVPGLPLGYEGRKVPVLCSPNNPTGHTISLAELESVPLPADSDVRCLVDLTYDFFSNDPLHTGISRLAARRIVSCVSFSKAFGVAGARIGMLAAPPDTVGEICSRHDRFGLDYFQLAVLDTLFDPRWDRERRSMIDWVRSAREEISVLLGGVFPPHCIGPREANFVSIRTDGLDRRLVNRLMESTACKLHPRDGILRITVNERSVMGVRTLHASLAVDGSVASGRAP